VREKWRWVPIEGSATFTIDASITTTNCVIARSASARFFARGEWSSVVVGSLPDVITIALFVAVC